MRIAFLEPVPRFAGGSERMTLALCRHALGQGHSCHLLYTEPGDMLPEYEKAGASCHRLPIHPAAVRAPLSACRSLGSLLRYARVHRPDALVSSHVSLASLLAAAGKLTGARTLLHLGLTYDFASPLFRAAIRLIDHGVAPSDHTARDWLARGWPARSLHRVPNGVDIDAFPPAPDRRIAKSKLGFSPDHDLVLYAGRLVKEKGVFTLLRAFAKLPDTRNARLCFVGPAPKNEAAELARLAADLGVSHDRLSIHPATRTPEHYYQAADIVAVPSEWEEPFGLAPLEAMACRAMVVVSDRGLLPSFVAPVGDEAVFPAGDADALADRLQRWLSDSPARAAASAALHHDVVSTRAFSSCGNQYLELLASPPVR